MFPTLQPCLPSFPMQRHPSLFLHSSCSRRRQHRLPLLPSLLRLALSTQSPSLQSDEEMPFIARYLISTFDFSTDRAIRYSSNSNLSPIKTPYRPESVIRFLKEIGLSDSQIKAAISMQPIILSYNVDETLRPRAHELREAGISREILVQLIRHNPLLLVLKNCNLQVQFWRDFIGNNDETLLKLIHRNPLVFSGNIEKSIVPKINLLKEYGLSDPQIVAMVLQGRRIMLQSLDRLRGALEKTQELGFVPGSGMFFVAFKSVYGLKKSTISRKIELLKKSCGWSEEEVYSAIKKYPRIFSYSEEKVRLAMDFLVKNAGYEPRSIATRPALLGYCLEKRLMPRHLVLSTLKAHGLTKCNIWTVCPLSEEHFFERYIVPYEMDVPELAEVYAAALAGKLPV